MTTHETAEHHKDLVGNRQFTWFTPAKRKPTEYESYTVGQYSDPDQWMDVGWPLRFDDGAERLVGGLQQGQDVAVEHLPRPVRRLAAPVRQPDQPGSAVARPPRPGAGEEQRGRATPRRGPRTCSRRPTRPGRSWSTGCSCRLAYAIRQAMSDTAQFATVFQAIDRLRLLQDIVLHLDHLTTETGFSDAGAREAWMSRPDAGPDPGARRAHLRQRGLGRDRRRRHAGVRADRRPPRQGGAVHPAGHRLPATPPRRW